MFQPAVCSKASMPCQAMPSSLHDTPDPTARMCVSVVATLHSHASSPKGLPTWVTVPAASVTTMSGVDR